MEFELNQIVKGKVAGTFVILGFRNIGGEQYAQLKEVNPNNYEETRPGEIALPVNNLMPVA
jgi:hypothetical protein